MIPVTERKTIQFFRASSDLVKEYRVYVKTEHEQILKEIIPNKPEHPFPVKKIPVSWNATQSYKLPIHAIRSSDYPFFFEVNGEAIDLTVCGIFNQETGWITILKKRMELKPDDDIVLCYYEDVIRRSYILEEDGSFLVEPVFYPYQKIGDHNLIQ